jgi:hypothetical protein
LNINMQAGELRENLAVAAEAARPQPPMASLARKSRAAPSELEETLDSVGGLRRQEAPSLAQARALGEQFEYKLPQAVTIRRNESGLLPIIQTEVDGEKVSLYNAALGERRPRLAVWLKNTSGLTLDSGSFTVIDTSAFAGEGLVETVQPGENRLLSYAVDLGVEVSADTQVDRQRIERVEISRGVMRMHSKLTEKRSYIVRNNDQRNRTLVIEHPVRVGWALVDTIDPAETSASFHRFRVEAGPKSTTELTIREETPRQTTYSIINITPEQIALWVRRRSIDPEIEEALSAVVSKKGEISELDRKIDALDREQQEIFRDQERVRGNLQRLGRTPEEASLRQRYIRQMEEQEDRLAALRSERDLLDSDRAENQKQLEEMLQSLTFDRKV